MSSVVSVEILNVSKNHLANLVEEPVEFSLTAPNVSLLFFISFTRALFFNHT